MVFSLSPRKALEGFSPYVPGQSLEEVKLKYGIGNAVKLASNESLWGCSPRVLESIRAELKNIHLYPESVPSKLVGLISGKTGFPAGSIIAGNGTDELIELLAKTYLDNGSSMVVSENSFIRYRMGGILMGAEVREVPQKDYRIDLAGIYEKIDSTTKLIFIDNPCNPTGTVLFFKELADFTEKLGRLKQPPMLILDEAYYEYAAAGPSYDTGLKLLKKGLPVMVLRTFSKIYGLAGMRIGYGIAAESVISDMNRIRPPFNTNRLAQAAAAGALEDESFVSRVSSEVQSEKEMLYSELEKAGFGYVVSYANFILVDTGDLTAEGLSRYLIENGVIVRPLAGYSLKNHLRVTVGRRDDNIRFLKLLKEYAVRRRNGGE